jgi:hypothetical protein
MAALALLLFLIALILKVVGAHQAWVIWLVIFGGILISACLLPWFRSYVWFDRR